MSDFSDQIQEHEDRITSLEDNQEQSSNDLQQYQDDLANNLEEIQQQQSDDEANIGQLTFPLSQDTIDLITEQAPAILQQYINQGYGGQITLVGGIGTATSNLITATSLIFYARAGINGSTKLGFLYVSAQSAGTFTITSLKTDSSGTETNDISIISYIIIG